VPSESGQFITKSEGELRQTWNREGGIDRVATAVRTAEAQMVASAPTIQSQTAKLPTDIQLIAADHLRLSKGYGTDWRLRRRQSSHSQRSCFGSFHEVLI
jgi:hypothetical protein